MTTSDTSTPVVFSIAAVERDTGIGKDTLRVWERRYGFPVPSRDAHDERSYPLVQVEKLRVIKRLMDQGHRPGRIVAQPIEALLAMRQDNVCELKVLYAQSERPEIAAFMALLKAHDDEALRLAMHQTLLELGLQKFVTDIVAPMTRAVGEAWAQGELAVHEEHEFTECVTNLMRHAISLIPRPSATATPVVLLSTFPQEAHGLGLLMVESLLALQGCRCVSLGTQTPVRDIAQAALVRHVDVVALSFSANMKVNHVVDGLKELTRLLPPTVQVWAGGQSSALQRRNTAPVVVLRALGDVEKAVMLWRQAHA
jgi:MerR family transcriptional regulator, light-induced transcriptional regulator